MSSIRFPQGEQADDAAGLQRDVDALHRLGVVGVQARLVTVDGREIVATSGVADLQTGAPMTGELFFRIGSATKTFVATVVLQLVGEGLLSLADPVERWLPGVVHGPGFDGAAISVRQLLQHTSGIHDDDPGFDSAEEYYERRYRLTTPEQLVARAMQHPLDFRPDTGWGYSNTGYQLLGMIVEQITGHPWYAEVQNRILKPLHLTNTVWPADSPRLPDPHARGYQRFPGSNDPIDVTEIVDANAAQGLIGTTSDLSRFFRALIGGQLLRPAELAEMQRTVPVDEGTQQLWPGGAYGLGLVSRPLSRGGVYWSHEGGQCGYITSNGITSDGSRSIVVSMSTALGDSLESRLQQEKLATALLDNALCGGH